MSAGNDVCPAQPWQLAAPLIILGLEVGALTPVVEYTHPPLAWIASPWLCAGVVFAIVVFFWLSWDGQSGPGRFRLANLIVHGSLYFSFFVYSLSLSQRQDAGLLDVGLWTVLALAVGVTCFLSFAAMGWWLSLVRREWPKLILAAALGIALPIVGTWLQWQWLWCHQPALVIDRQVLQWLYGQAQAGTTLDGVPALRAGRIILIITPQCSEFESFAVFWFLGLALLIVSWQRIDKLRLFAVLVLGTLAIYGLLTVRVVLLMIAGIHGSPDAASRLAHSRLGGLVILCLALVFLRMTARWYRKTAVAANFQFAVR